MTTAQSGFNAIKVYQTYRYLVVISWIFLGFKMKETHCVDTHTQSFPTSKQHLNSKLDTFPHDLFADLWTSIIP